MLRSQSMANVTSDSRSSAQLGSMPTNLSGSAATLSVNRCYLGRQTPLSGSTLSLAQGVPNFRRMPRVGRVPIPDRAEAMFIAAKKGLRECIENSENQILRLQSYPSTYSHHAANLERFKARLQTRLGLVEDLESDYKYYLAMREEVKQRPGEVRSPHPEGLTYKSCCEKLCSVEAQFEYLLGTLKCQIGELSGFARLCPGDCFELSIRYGEQKWKSRVRIDRGMRQHWDNASAVLSPSVGELLNIRASEVKMFRHRTTLGEKQCEIRDLLAGDPRCLSLNLNAVGTLKLKLICEWCPLAEDQESDSTLDTSSLLLYYTPVRRPPRDSGTAALTDGQVGLRQVSSGSASVGATPVERHRYSMLLTDSDDESEATPPALPPKMPEPPQMPTVVLPTSTSAHSLSASSSSTPGSASQQSSMRGGRELATVVDASPPRGDGESGVHLVRLVRALLAQIEDVRGEHCVYEPLEDALHRLNDCLRWPDKATMSRSHTAPSASMMVGDEAIESALDRAFDFLEEEDEGEEEDQLAVNRCLSSMSTTRTQSNDSGLFMPSSTLSSPPVLEPPRATFARDASCGWPWLDPVLTWHLCHTQVVLHRFVTTTFKDHSARQVSCLQEQSVALMGISRMLNSVQERARSTGQLLSTMQPDVQDALQVVAVNTKELKHFWIKCLSNNPLLINVESTKRQLAKSYAAQVKKKFGLEIGAVLTELIDDFVHLYHDPGRNDKRLVTIYQFFSFFSEVTLEKAVMDKTREIWVRTCLSSANESVLHITLENHLFTIPPACWLYLCSLLTHPTNAVQKNARSRLQRLTNTAFKRKTAIHCLVELGLVDASDHMLRIAACFGLDFLRAEEVTSELVWASQRDPHPDVRRAARDTLLALGEKGKRAYDVGQLSLHGFQNLTLGSAGPAVGRTGDGSHMRPNITTSFT